MSKFLENMSDKILHKYYVHCLSEKQTYQIKTTEYKNKAEKANIEIIKRIIEKNS